MRKLRANLSICLWRKRNGQIGSVDGRARSPLRADSGPDARLAGDCQPYRTHAVYLDFS
jgi:hypothetical protein